MLKTLSTNLPNEQKYPNNIHIKSRVEPFVKQEFESSTEFLVVTGFSSLSYLIDFFGKKEADWKKKIRIVLGNELINKNNTHRQTYNSANVSLPQEIIDYWLEQGISPFQSFAVVNLIELINNQIVDFRILEGLHAKVYIGENHAILGSSNFSSSGLKIQIEGNFRASKENQLEEYEEQKKLAEYCFNNGQNYNQEIIKLLNNLLRYVSWQESLARAVSELVEGEWLNEYPEFLKLLQNLHPPLWKTQMEAIGQALYIMDNNGSLLIADPTGSGKTRLGAVLQACIINRLWFRGAGHNMENTNALLICPPQVLDNWQKEFRDLRSDFNNLLSQGQLSINNEKSIEENNERIQNARILFIDEAHNFLNKTSKRSLTIQYNTADNLVLYTATPINRRIEDLFRLIEILDIDNLAEHALKEYERLSKLVRKGMNISQHDENALRGYIKDFIIRRTKKELNKKIDENPEMYKNSEGKMCRYPKQECRSYFLCETESDIIIAKKINELSQQLKGLIRLREINLKKEEIRNVDKQYKILENRQNAAKALSIYNLQSTLRSSKIALIEHIKGTEKAKEIAEKEGYPLPKSLKHEQETGNIIDKLRKYKKELPKHKFTIQLPSWLTDLDEYAKVCEKEIDLYEQIYQLSLQLSTQREEKKAHFLIELLQKNKLILAFDSKVVSLYFIQKIAEKLDKSIQYLVVIGGNQTAKKQAKEYFGFGSNKTNMIGFCSDVMSEGVNLQQASVVVLLDLPSVMRIAEQRIGRIDRMNSPHEKVEIYFPNDHEEFALRTDKKFYLTAKTVENVLGGNLDLPEDQLERWNVEMFSAQQVIKLYEEEKDKAENHYRDGIQDAFQPVKDLIFGKNNIVDSEIYYQVKNTKAALLSKVEISKVGAIKDFAFFCVRGSKYYAPYWLYLDEDTIKDRKNPVLKDLPKICQKLMDNLSSASNLDRLDYLQEEQQIKEKYISLIKKNEITNLPNKKRRSIDLLRHLIDIYLSGVDLFQQPDLHREKVLLEIKQILNGSGEDETSIDFYHFAQNWIRIIQPRLIQVKKANSRKLIHLTSSLFLKELKNNPVTTQEFEILKNETIIIKPLEKRIASCIIGIRIKT